MKKTLIKILCFALALFALLGVSSLLGRLSRQTEDAQEQLPQTETEDTTLQTQSLELSGATQITLSGSRAAVYGTGAAATGSTVTIAHPGVYVISGTLDDGCVVVDCQFEGGVCLVLNGADIRCSTGSAIDIRQAYGTIVYLAEGTENFLSDGSVYATVTDTDGQALEKQPDAALYSADDLVISGEGVLTIQANYTYAVHSRDSFTLAGGTVEITSVQNGIKAADGVDILAGTITLDCALNGVSSSKKSVSISDGALLISCGADAVSAAKKIELSGGTLTIEDCREGLEAPVVLLSGGTAAIVAEENAIDAGMGDVDSGVAAQDCSVTVCGGSLYALASCCVRTDGAFYVTDGQAFLRAMTADSSPLSAAESVVSGGALFLCGDFDSSVLTADGGVNAVYYRASSTVAAGESVSLADANGETFFSLNPNVSFNAVLIAYSGLVDGEQGTLTCGGESLSFTQTDWLVTAAQAGFGGASGDMMGASGDMMGASRDMGGRGGRM